MQGDDDGDDDVVSERVVVVTPCNRRDACAPRFPARNDVKLAENHRTPPNRPLSSSAGCILPRGSEANARGSPTLLYTY